MNNNNISPRNAIENDGYINYIKSLIADMSVYRLLKDIDNEGYLVLKNCINKAIGVN